MPHGRHLRGVASWGWANQLPLGEQKGKVLADVAEALIGCMYVEVGEEAAWKLLQALGVLPRLEATSHAHGKLNAKAPPTGSS